MDYVTFDKLCKSNGTTATALTLKLGLSKGNTTSWKKGGNPSAEILIKMADELNCTVDALLGRASPSTLTADEQELIFSFNRLSERDKGKVIERAEILAELAAERAAQEAERVSKQVGTSKNIAPKALPKLKETEKHEIIYYPFPASVGTGLFLDETKAVKKYVKPTSESLNADFAIPISGDSMEPDYSSGDIILVESCPNVPMGKVGIFVLDGEVYIKEYGGDRLISYNEKYPPIMLRKFESAICLGLVLGKAEIVE